MAMSDDIRSVRSFLGALNVETFKHKIINKKCSNMP